MPDGEWRFFEVLYYASRSSLPSSTFTLSYSISIHRRGSIAQGKGQLTNYVWGKIEIPQSPRLPLRPRPPSRNRRAHPDARRYPLPPYARPRTRGRSSEAIGPPHPGVPSLSHGRSPSLQPNNFNRPTHLRFRFRSTFFGTAHEP